VSEAPAPRRRRKKNTRKKNKARRKKTRKASITPEAAQSSYAQTLAHQRRMALAATTTIVGVAMVGIEESFWGGVMVVAGLLGMIATIHLFGRLGHDRPAH
jgi:hypothetical protein